MATASVTQFRSEFPEFASGPFQTDDAAIERAITRAERLHDATIAGTLYAAAHLICLDAEKTAAAPDGGSGVVSKEKIGAKEVEYETNAGANERRAFWSRSPYGREFMMIESRNVRQGFGILVA